jgi:lysophospholipase L1-like esterase
MIQGIMLALIGLIICPIWHQINPPSIHYGYLAGLAVVTTGVFVQFVSLLLKIRNHQRTGQGKRSIQAGLSLVVLFCIYLFLELAASAWVQLSGNRGELLEFRLAQRMQGEHQFIPHPFLSYVKNPDFDQVNIYGFKGHDWETAAEPGGIRIACIGGSTTEDGYSELLETRLLASFLGRNITVMNLGVSGWTSAHCLVNYVLNGRHFKPDYVVIHQGANDYKATWQGDVRTDYSHAFKPLEMPSRPLDYVFMSYLNSYAIIKLKYFQWQDRPAKPGLYQLMMREPDPNRDVSEDIDKVANIYSVNIQALIKLALDDGSSVIMMTQPYSRTNREWGAAFIPHMERINSAVLSRSVEFGLPLIDLDKELAGREEYFVDPLHLVDDGVELKARKVSMVITQLIRDGEQ